MVDHFIAARRAVKVYALGPSAAPGPPRNWTGPQYMNMFNRLDPTRLNAFPRQQHRQRAPPPALALLQPYPQTRPLVMRHRLGQLQQYSHPGLG